MKTIWVVILSIPAFFLILTGCAETPSPAEPYPTRSPRLKITDLEPSDAVSLEVQCVFSVILYRLPLKEIDSVPDVLSQLSTKRIQFDDPEGFSANHIWAAAGDSAQGPEVVTALGRLEAERIGIKKIILFQDYPEELTGFPVEAGRALFYLRGDGTLAGRRVPAGRFSLVLRAQPDLPRRGFSHVEIEPLFRQAALANLPIATRDSLMQSFSLHEGRFGLDMAEGDFLILSAVKIQQDGSALGRFFLDPDSPETSARLYLILCQQAGVM